MLTSVKKWTQLVPTTPICCRPLLLDVDMSPITVGRNAEVSDLVPSWHLALSRKHCRLLWDGDNWSVVDLCSLNGTMVSGETVGCFPVKLKKGDTLRLGHDALSFTVAEGDA